MKRFLYCLIILFVSAHLFAYDFTLTSIETEKNSVTVYRGKSMQTVLDDNYLISMLATKNSHGIQFSTSITNYSSNDYLFKENCISVYQGVYENNNWERIEYVPASIYFEQEKRSARAEEIATAIALGISAASAGYSTVTGTGYSRGYRYTYTAKVYSPADAAIATTNSMIALDNLQQNNQEYLSYLENNLLFDSLIPANDNYNGIFVVDEKKGPDYKVVFEFSPTEQFVFYFTRSDKDEILNPWKDKSRSRHSVIVGVSPLFNHFSAYYLWSRPKGVGLYAGLSYRYEGAGISPFSEVYDVDRIEGYNLHYADPENVGYYNYDWKFDYTETRYNSLGMNLGLTIKTFPNTWLLLGAGVDLKSHLYYKGKLYYKVDTYSRHDKTYTYYNDCWLEDTNPTDGCIMFTPHIGVNFITNKLDVGAMFSYSIKGHMSFDIMAGIAF